MKDEDMHPDGSHRELYEQAVARLDPATANRLRLMRRAALAAPAANRARTLVPAAVFAIGLLALGLGWRMHGGDLPATSAAPTADVDLALDLASDEDAALYAWLGEAPVAAEGETL